MLPPGGGHLLGPCVPSRCLCPLAGTWGFLRAVLSFPGGLWRVITVPKMHIQENPGSVPGLSCPHSLNCQTSLHLRSLPFPVSI